MWSRQANRMRYRFRTFNSSPAAICTAMLLCIRFPLSVRQVEDLLEARCTNSEVMAISGQKTDEMVGKYGRGARQRRLAQSAMDRLSDERSKNRSTDQTANPVKNCEPETNRNAINNC
jgi:hypothetical protein